MGAHCAQPGPAAHPLVLQVALVAHQHESDILRAIGPQLLRPVRHLGVGPAVHEGKNKQRRVCVPVILGRGDGEGVGTRHCAIAAAAALPRTMGARAAYRSCPEVSHTLNWRVWPAYTMDLVVNAALGPEARRGMGEAHGASRGGDVASGVPDARDRVAQDAPRWRRGHGPDGGVDDRMELVGHESGDDRGLSRAALAKENHLHLVSGHGRRRGPCAG